MDYKPTYMIEDLFRIAVGFPMHLLRSRKAFLTELHHLLETLPAVADNWDDFVTQEDLATALPLCRFGTIFSAEIRDDLVRVNGPSATAELGMLLSLLFPLEESAEIEQHVITRHKKSWLGELLWRKSQYDLEEDDAQVLDRLATLGKILKGMDCPKPVLWKIEDIPVDEFKAFQAEFKKTYLSAGQKAATEFLEKTRSQASSTLADYLQHRFPK